MLLLCIIILKGSALQWGTYEASRRLFSRLFQDPIKDAYWITSLSGALASTTSTLFTNPLDVMRIRTQVLDISRKSDRHLLENGYWWMASKLMKERGYSVFMKGLGARLCIGVPGSVIAMCGYETVKSCSLVETRKKDDDRCLV